MKQVRVGCGQTPILTESLLLIAKISAVREESAFDAVAQHAQRGALVAERCAILRELYIASGSLAEILFSPEKFRSGVIGFDLRTRLHRRLRDPR